MFHFFDLAPRSLLITIQSMHEPEQQSRTFGMNEESASGLKGVASCENPAPAIIIIAGTGIHFLTFRDVQ